MKDKVKKLYFTNDFSASNVQKLQGEGWIIRNAQLAKSDSFVEKADEYGGDVPERYKANIGKVTVELDVQTSPELQQAIDEAKAECEKVVEENTALKAQIEALSANESAKSELESENSRLKDSVLILENAQKESLEQLQTAKGEFIAFQNNIDAMKARITELEANADKTDEEKSKTTKTK
ncbi:hypothetical protein [Acinetobacter bereziniae]|uniref:hypothetical protein n=1 Tax=Acinetobacter bereziniae TaxID=106648 RepID=UPI001C08F96D|nr:hypothetical protein [Acinetobacter bereziniae]